LDDGRGPFFAQQPDRLKEFLHLRDEALRRVRVKRHPVSAAPRVAHAFPTAELVLLAPSGRRVAGKHGAGSGEVVDVALRARHHNRVVELSHAQLAELQVLAKASDRRPSVVE
jgi:hypothetical protein